MRILDDRSLNGVFLNGERIDWHELDDGDRDHDRPLRPALHLLDRAGARPARDRARHAAVG